MLWYVLGEYEKIIKEKKKLYKKLDKKDIIIFIVLSIAAIVTNIWSTKKMYWSVVISTYIFSIPLGMWMGNKYNKLFIKEYKSHLDNYRNNLTRLEQILINMGLWKKEKIDYLIKQTEEEIKELKLSDKIFKPIAVVINIILIPIIVNLYKWLLDKGGSDYNIYLFFITISHIVFIILGFYYMLKNPITKLIDCYYFKMKELRKLLQDILLRRFI